MEHKGTVLELGRYTAYVMTEECDFVEIRLRKGMEQGQEVTFNQKDIVSPRSLRLPSRINVVLAACLALLFICAPLYALYQDIFVRPYAYVSIDINPSLEMAVNKKLVVVGTRPFNEDGARLLERAAVSGRPVKEAMSQLVEAAGEMGYVHPGKEDYVLVCISPVREGRELPGKLETAVRSALEKPGAGMPKDSVGFITSDPRQREEAVEKGVSPGRFALWQQVQEGGEPVTLEEFAFRSVAGLIGKNAKGSGEKSTVTDKGQAAEKRREALEHKPDRVEETPGKNSKNNSDGIKTPAAKNGYKNASPASPEFKTEDEPGNKPLLPANPPGLQKAAEETGEQLDSLNNIPEVVPGEKMPIPRQPGKAVNGNALAPPQPGNVAEGKGEDGLRSAGEVSEQEPSSLPQTNAAEGVDSDAAPVF